MSADTDKQVALWREAAEDAQRRWGEALGRAEAAEAQRDTLATALEEIESFPVSGYHAGAAQRIARAALAAVEPPEEQEG